MQAFRNIVSSFTRTPDGKHPPDETLQKHRDDLNSLRDQLTQVRQQFTTYTTNLIQASESGVILSKHVAQFYQSVEHSGTLKSVQTYHTVNEEIANHVVKVFQEQTQLPEGLIAELDNWLEVIKLLEQEIEDAERARAAAQSTSDRLHTLKEQHERLKKKQTSTATSNAGNANTTQQEIRDLEERINDTTNVKKSLTKDFQDQKQKISDVVTNMLKEKFRIFDRVYVQLLECQLAFVGSCNELTRPFKSSIDYYRKQYPKTYSDFSAHPLHQSTHQLLQHSKMDLEHGNDLTADRSTEKMMNNEINGKTKNNTENELVDPDASISNEENQLKAAAAANKERNGRNNSVGNKNGDINVVANGSSHLQGNNGGNNSATRSNRSGTIPSNNSQHQGGNPSESKIAPSVVPSVVVGAQITSPQQHNDFLFGEDFGMPVTGSQPTPAKQNQQKSEPNMIDVDFGGFINVSPSTTTETKQNVHKGQHEKQFSIGSLFREDNIPEEKPKPGKNVGSTTKGDQQPKQEEYKSSNLTDAPPMERNSSGDFWGIFGNPAGTTSDTSANNKQNSAEGSKSPTKVAPAKSNVNSHATTDTTRFSKSDSQISRQSVPVSPVSPRKGQNQGPSQLEPVKEENRAKSVTPNLIDEDAQSKIEKRVQERIRFVKDSYVQEAKEQAEKTKFKDELEARLDEWEYANGVRRNIRSLLTKLPEILWEDSGWKPVSLGDLVQPAKCKKSYQVALRLVHPDRAANRGDDARKAVICERVFTALNEAWAEFEKTM